MDAAAWGERCDLQPGEQGESPTSHSLAAHVWASHSLPSVSASQLEGKHHQDSGLIGRLPRCHPDPGTPEGLTLETCAHWMEVRKVGNTDLLGLSWESLWRPHGQHPWGPSSHTVGADRKHRDHHQPRGLSPRKVHGPF